VVHECFWFGGLLGLLDTGSRHGLVVGKSGAWKYDAAGGVDKVKSL